MDIMKTLTVPFILGVTVLINFAKGCDDLHEHCSYFAGEGLCTKEDVRPWMTENCKKSCNLCGGGGGGGGSEDGKEMYQNEKRTYRPIVFGILLAVSVIGSTDLNNRSKS